MSAYYLILILHLTKAYIQVIVIINNKIQCQCIKGSFGITCQYSKENNVIEILEQIETNLFDEDKQLNDLTNEIYELCGLNFNIGSPKQLGEVLFEKLEIGKGKKNTIGYKTDSKTLQKYIDKHPVIEKVLEYRMYFTIF